MTFDILHGNFDEIAKKVIKEAETFPFYLQDLPEVKFYPMEIKKDLNLSSLFNTLDKKLSNCLYWFETETPEYCNNLRIHLDNSRDQLEENKRKVPVKNNNSDSCVLYVGIRQGGYRKKDNSSFISGRIYIHLGYYKPATPGLQLAHWAKDFNYKINLKVVQFENLPNEYLSIIEKIVALKLKPLCGKH